MNNFMSLILLTCLVSCTSSSDREVEIFFEKLNVLSMKKQAIVSNMQNVNTTRTIKGGPYIPIRATGCIRGVCKITQLLSEGPGAKKKSPREPFLRYEPDHPDSNKNGYVAYPNINLEEEKLKFERITLATKFLLEQMPVSYSFFFSDDSQVLFQKFSALDSEFNFKKLLEE